jgi:large subunit ribosomal protein L23
MSVIRKPIITEKFSALSEKENKYSFIVDRKANKEEIKTEVEKLYQVKVLDVNTMIYPGKKKTRYTRRNIITGRTKSFKKAIVTLKQGDQIDFYSNI